MRRLAVAMLALVGCAHKQAPPPAEPVRQSAAPAPPAEEPDEGMRVAGTLGTLSDDEINGPFQRRWDDITKCYQEGASKLPYLGGKLELKLRVDGKGEVKKVYVSSSTMGNYEVERCILAVARSLDFAKPHGGPEAEFTYPLEFHAQRGVSTWDPSRVPIARHRRDLTACKARSPNGLPIALAITVYVAPGGRVTSAGLSADAPLDDAFATCLVDKTRAWRLDDPLGRIAKATVPVGD